MWCKLLEKKSPVECHMRCTYDDAMVMLTAISGIPKCSDFKFKFPKFYGAFTPRPELYHQAFPCLLPHTLKPGPSVQCHWLPGVCRRRRRGRWPVTSRRPRDRHDWWSRRSLDRTARRPSERPYSQSRWSVNQTHTFVTVSAVHAMLQGIATLTVGPYVFTAYMHNA